MKIHCFGNSHLWTLVGGSPRNDERIVCVDGDLELHGWKLGGSGATAYGLLKHHSVTDAGDNIVRILDEEPEPRKDVLMVFGEVDVTEHIGHHGHAEEEELIAAVDRYAEFLRSIKSRPDVGLVLVTSLVPHSAIFHGDDGPRIRHVCNMWNVALAATCIRDGFTYVDWYDVIDGVDGSLDGIVEPELCKDPAAPSECHLGPMAHDLLMGALRAALGRLDS